MTIPYKYTLFDLSRSFLNQKTTTNNLLTSSTQSEAEALEAYNFEDGTSEVKLNNSMSIFRCCVYNILFILSHLNSLLYTACTIGLCSCISTEWDVVNPFKRND